MSEFEYLSMQLQRIEDIQSEILGLLSQISQNAKDCGNDGTNAKQDIPEQLKSVSDFTLRLDGLI